MQSMQMHAFWQNLALKLDNKKGGGEVSESCKTHLWSDLFHISFVLK